MRTFKIPNEENCHMLSFDVEEYFQVEAAADAIKRDDWSSIAQRLNPVVRQILELLDERQAKATFFVLGWVAQHQRQLVRQISQQGHEIASHGMSHTMLNRLSANEFHQELINSRHLLEDISGREVIGFRAPTFSLTKDTAWALDVLAETGFRYDSSVFPIRHDRYGVPNAPTAPHFAVGPDGNKILEIPPLTLRIMGVNFPVGGGGYMRLLPIRAVDWALKNAQRRGQLGMIYLHPWELDAFQPKLPTKMLSRCRHRIGLRRTKKKLSWLLKRHPMTSVCRQLDTLYENTIDSHTYG